MRTHTIEGIITRRQNLGDQDKIITVFTKTQGRMRLKARGIRKINSRRASHIELLNHVVITYYKNTSLLPFLTEISTLHTYPLLKNNLSHMGYAFHVCELINNLCPENQEYNSVFFLLQNILTDLSKYTSPKEHQDIISVFEKHLLVDLGYLPVNHVISANESITSVIESILEKKLKTRYLFPHFMISN